MNVLDYAINMEMEGVDFYNDLALTLEGSGLHKVCLSLAQDETNHAKIITNLKNSIKMPLKERPALDTNNIFSGNDFFKNEKKYSGQIDLYKLALGKEQESIDLYKRLLDEMKEDKSIYAFLIKQEEEHYSVISEILKMLTRPNDWVESAEFGVREEY
jgi:rubrerythrin